MSASSAAFDLADALAILERTPIVLRSWLADLPDAWLRADEGPDTFSPIEVLGHLIHGERTDWMTRTRAILGHETTRFEPFDRFAQRQDFVGWSAVQLLDEFAQLRAANLKTLRALPIAEATLAREGHHPELGTVTLGELLATWVVHDLSHMGQIARVMAKRYGSAVGPWRAYLPILQR
ncbi:MAG: DinB family protein [Gemmatimonadota bacterium]|nr:DinB family protein [Gemmatimonadota bacterium]MDH4350827.1 DinB family protein [Gemmatimonadota bacterium]MDH5196295.1 DinB family protein [Gemmatimonadota bacterium]